MELADRLGIELNEHHFAKTGSFSPVATSRPGIYVCGLSESPKDIPETMVQASAAACMASSRLKSSEERVEEEEDLPPERDVSQEEPRIGVFVCDCGTNIGGFIDVFKLVDYARRTASGGGLPDDRARLFPRVPGEGFSVLFRKRT